MARRYVSSRLQNPWSGRGFEVAASWVSSAIIAWVLVVRLPPGSLGPGLTWESLAVDAGIGLGAGVVAALVSWLLNAAGANAPFLRETWRLAAVGAVFFLAAFWPIAAELGRGDALVAAGLGAAVTIGAAAALFGGAAVAVWNALELLPSHPRRRAWLVALPATCAPLLAIASASPAYQFLLHAIVPLAVWLLTSTLSAMVRQLPRHRHIATLIAIVALSAALWRGSREGVGSFAMHPLAGISPVADAAAHWLGGATHAVRFDIAAVDPRACRAVPRSPAASGGFGARSVVIVSVDALRWDAPGATFESRAIMPNLARFLDGSVVARRATTTYPATVFALGSAFTGLSPSQMLFAPRPPRSVLGAARERVRTTLAVLPDSKWFRMPVIDTYLTQGMERVMLRDAVEQTDAAIRHLDAVRQSGESTLLWVHYFEPHMPHTRHSGFSYGSGTRGDYLSELGYLDVQLGRLYAEVEKMQEATETLVVFLSDHGEALGERGHVGHHVFLHGYVTDVPLAFRFPGGKPRTATGSFDLRSVYATLTEFLGLPPDPDSDGWSALRGDPPPERVSVSEAFPIRGRALFELASDPLTSFDELHVRLAQIETGVPRYSPKVALVSDPYRLIVDRQSGVMSLYDRFADPLEERDLARIEPERARKLRRQLGAWHEDIAEKIVCRLAREGGAP